MFYDSILTYPNRSLRNECREFNGIDHDVLQTLELLRSGLASSQPSGIGLAAPQVGRRDPVVVADILNDTPSGGIVEFIDPKIEERIGEATFTEGCLSLPDVWLPVTRAKKVTVSYFDRSGVRNFADFSEYSAAVIQHEIEHLEGKLIIDYLSPLKHDMAKRRMVKLKKRAGIRDMA